MGKFPWVLQNMGKFPWVLQNMGKFPWVLQNMGKLWHDMAWHSEKSSSWMISGWSISINPQVARCRQMSPGHIAMRLKMQARLWRVKSVSEALMAKPTWQLGLTTMGRWHRGPFFVYVHVCGIFVPPTFWAYTVNYVHYYRNRNHVWIWGLVWKCWEHTCIILHPLVYHHFSYENHTCLIFFWAGQSMKHFQTHPHDLSRGEHSKPCAIRTSCSASRSMPLPTASCKLVSPTKAAIRWRLLSTSDRACQTWALFLGWEELTCENLSGQPLAFTIQSHQLNHINEYIGNNTPRPGVPPGRIINYHQPYMGVSSTISIHIYTYV